MQIDVSQQRRERPPLWGPSFRWLPWFVDLLKACFKDAVDESQDPWIYDLLLEHLEQLLVVDAIEEAFDVGFENMSILVDSFRSLGDAVLSAFVWPEAKGARKKDLLINGFEQERERSLHDPIFDVGYSEGSFSSIPFGDVNPANRSWAIGFVSKLLTE